MQNERKRLQMHTNITTGTYIPIIIYTKNKRCPLKRKVYRIPVLLTLVSPWFIILNIPFYEYGKRNQLDVWLQLYIRKSAEPILQWTDVINVYIYYTTGENNNGICKKKHTHLLAKLTLSLLVLFHKIHCTCA